MAPFPRRLLFLLFACLAMPVYGQDDSRRLDHVELDRGQALRISDYGGPRIEVRIKNREMSYIQFEITDYTKLIRIPPGNPLITPGASSVESWVPTRITKTVEKHNPINDPSSNHGMYDLYEEPKSGIRVYFVDLVSRQNSDSLVVSTPLKGTFHTESLADRRRKAPLPKSGAPAESSSASAAPQFLSNELAAWYGRLGRERETLDVNNAQAVEVYNKHAAEYREALAKARAEVEAARQAPR